MWIQLVLLLGILVGGVYCAAGALHARRRRKRYRLAMDRFISTPEDIRTRAMQTLIDGSATHGPAWYLLGCALLRTSRTKEAARAFGFAHHCDCNLETAALLTFACLKAKEGEGSDIIEQILITWEELGQPDLARRVEDRRMLSCLASTSRDASTTPVLHGRDGLEQLIRLVIDPMQKSRFEQMIAKGDPWYYAPLADPTG